MEVRRQGFPGESLIVLTRALCEQLSRDPLCERLYFTDIGIFPRASNHYVERASGTDEYVIQFCFDGEGFCQFGAETFDVAAGQYFIVPPGSGHAYGSKPGAEWQVGWIHFRGESAARIANEVNRQGYGQPHTMDVSRKWYRAFTDLILALKEDLGYPNVVHCSTRLWSLFSTLLYADRIPGREGVLKPADKAVRFIHRNVHEHVTLDDIAAHVKLSRSRLSALFKERMNVSPVEYLITQKVQRACSYLSMTEWTVREIAQMLAFDDPYYFSRCFKKRMGVSPRAYRSSHIIQSSD